ncbi:hypothetical protein phiYS61_30 [Weissella phage phiYS61]|uniref:hypothetical protein n=1 Tax=Weissella phage phiYS61 TaxID=1161906 RepID=UPI000274E245|nr:hypothetical protein phiYS61_30 [Weissella phage phiYS61]AFF27988.1 hypothetical protein phiYS61_30 [Weissella phage phiYS61]
MFGMFEKKDLDTLEGLYHKLYELQGKIARLKFALLNAMQLGISKDQRDLMTPQIEAMVGYANVLIDRITDLEEILDNNF